MFLVSRQRHLSIATTQAKCVDWLPFLEKFYGIIGRPGKHPIFRTRVRYLGNIPQPDCCALQMKFPSRRLSLPAAVSACLIGILLLSLGVEPVRSRTLRNFGHLLVASDPLDKADVIVIAADADGAGVLEAADLFHAGVAPQVAVFTDPPDAIDREFLRRGVPYFNAAAASLQQLRSLGVQPILRIPRAVAGTEDEGIVLPGWCVENRYRKIIFIATTDHSRRSRRILARAMRESGTEVIVRPTRYSDFDPDGWWHDRGGVRTQIIESQKLLLDVLRHPLS